MRQWHFLAVALCACRPASPAPLHDTRSLGSAKPSVDAGLQPCRDGTWLDDEEHVLDAVCTRRRDLVLTNKSLLVFTRPDDAESGGDETTSIALVEAQSKTDLQAILRPGLVAWAHSEKATYFLTRDGKLTIIPLEEMGDSVETYAFGDVRETHMVYFDGQLFIGPVGGQLWVANALDDGLEWRRLALPRSTVSMPTLHADHGVLLYGDQVIALRSRAIGP